MRLLGEKGRPFAKPGSASAGEELEVRMVNEDCLEQEQPDHHDDENRRQRQPHRRAAGAVSAEARRLLGAVAVEAAGRTDARRPRLDRTIGYLMVQRQSRT